ncbi:MAG TPA: hypothetical protein VIX19_20430, partial [Terriglobales bacterium]
GLIPQTLENQQTVCGLERNEPKRTRYEPKTNPTWAKQRNPKEINQKGTRVRDLRPKGRFLAAASKIAAIM